MSKKIPMTPSGIEPPFHDFILFNTKDLRADYVIDLLIKQFLYRVPFRKTEQQTVGLFRTRNIKLLPSDQYALSNI
jgi:hypothetical protein